MSSKRDWVDEILDVGADVAEGKFALVTRTGRGQVRRGKDYDTKKIAVTRASRIDNASGEACLVGYVIERCGGELVCWIGMNVLLRVRKERTNTHQRCSGCGKMVRRTANICPFCNPVARVG